MARKKNKGRKAQQQSLANLEASLKKLQSTLVDPDVLKWAMNGGAQGVRERLLKINFNVLRNTVDKIPLINAIINTRVDQVSAFSCYVTEEQYREGAQGFRIISTNRRDNSSYDEETADQLGEFFEQTGFVYDANREDDFSDYLQMLTREILTIDQIATELQYNRIGEVIAFWLLDGATIKRATDDYKNKNVTFVQEIEDRLQEEYNGNNLLFDYKNKRADIRYRGFGYSLVEMAIDLVTTILFGYQHLRDQFVRDKIPKGFISVMGDIDGPGISAIQQYWYSAMSGAGGQWSIPILPSGKDGVGIDFKPIGTNNRDMEYHRMMMFISSMISAVFSMDMTELGIKADDSTALIGENSKNRVDASKDRGLKSILSFIQQHMNKIMRKVTTDYRLVFTPLDPEDDMKVADLRKKKVETDISIDELRVADGKKPYNESWSKMPLHPGAIQIYLAELESKQSENNNEDMQQQGEEEDNWPPDTNNDNDNEGEEELNTNNSSNNNNDIEKEFNKAESFEDWQNLFYNLTVDKE